MTGKEINMEYETRSKNLQRMSLIGGIALGALVMYLADPSQGRRRRALLRDQVNSASHKTSKLVGQTVRDARNRFAGLQAEATRLLTQEDAKLERCKIDSEHILKEEKIKCELEVQKVTYDFTIYKETNEALMIEKDKELDKLYEILKKNPANHTPLWIGIGFIAGIGTSIGMIYAYEQMQ